MKKVFPIILLVLAIIAALLAATVFAITLLVILAPTLELVILLIISVITLIVTTVVSFGTMIFGFITRQERLCKITAFVGLAGFVISVACWLLIWIGG